MSAHDEKTDPYGTPPPSDPQADDAPERFAALVAKELDVRVATIVEAESGTRKAVRDLADAFNQHTADEAKRHAAMVKVLAVRSVTPMVAMLVALLALGMAMGGGEAQASGPRCPKVEAAP